MQGQLLQTLGTTESRGLSVPSEQSSNPMALQPQRIHHQVPPCLGRLQDLQSSAWRADTAQLPLPAEWQGRGQDQNPPPAPSGQTGKCCVPMTLFSTTGHCTTNLLKIKLLLKHPFFLLHYERLSGSSKLNFFFAVFCFKPMKLNVYSSLGAGNPT